MRFGTPRSVKFEIASLKHELKEAESEINRHHKDFQQISEIVHEVLNREPYNAEMFRTALQEIRKIVG